MSRTTSKAERLIEISEMMRLKPRRVAELAREFEVSRRTIERDLEAVARMHPLEENNHRYSIARRGSPLNDVEALAMHSAARLLVHTGVGERHYRSALAKLADQLPEPARETLVRSMERLSPREDGRTLDLIAQAWFQGRVLRAEYRSSRGRNWHPNEYEIYFFELNRRNLEPYVVAFERTYSREVRVFKLARMRNLRVLDDYYEVPEDFDPHEFLAGAWGIVVGDETVEVRLRAEPTVASWFREREAQDENVRVVSEFDDGGVEAVVTGRLASSGDANELTSFLLGLGSNIEVLEPEDIRERVARDLRAAAERYE